MKEKKKIISEELLKEAIYDAIHDAAIENGKCYGVFENNGETYYDICETPEDSLVHFEFDKEYIKTYLYFCRFIDDFVDAYYENNIDEIIERIKNKESAEVEWDI